jgi:hypothetical protein
VLTLHEHKANKVQVDQIEQSMYDQGNKLKHLSVFASELAASLQPGEKGIKVLQQEEQHRAV